ncbi:MAG TPA: hypothetical protein VJ919_03400 [Tangfeifania sp.]|nr:hypothetical protein [Tangfeifania sp.]
MKTIELQVNDKIAEKISKLDPASRRLLSKKIEDFVSEESNFMQNVRKMQREAKKNGLTQEILNDILKDV